MINRWLLSLLFAVSGDALAKQVRVATFNIGAHFNETYFDYSLGNAGTPDHDSVREILARINADVVALQEIHSVDLQGSPNDVDDLAASLGYDYQYVPPVSGSFDTSLRVVILSRFPFLETGHVTSPEGAKEMTRLHPVVRVDVPGTERDPLLVSVHLKAGTGSADRFRRAVEMKRVVGYLTGAGVGDDENFMVLGDFNPSAVDATYSALPSGLPGSYVLGADVTLPVSYSTNPATYFASPAAMLLDARQVDGSASTYDTAAPGGPALDLILVSPAIARRTCAAEVYNSTLDASNGVGLQKAGPPLSESISAMASDHYAVFVDVELDDPGPYELTEAGQTVVEDFTGFAGNHDPARWRTVSDAAWLGMDDGSSSAPGWRSYGAAPDGSLGFFGNGVSATAKTQFVNGSQVPITAVRIALDVEHWRSVTNGAVDGIESALLIGEERIPLSGLAFSASGDGGMVTALSEKVTGVSILPGESFELLISFRPGEGGGETPDEVFLNEFHYDNSGTDAGEFVEIVIGPGFGAALEDVSLLLYNGGDGGVYGTHSLDTFTLGETTDSGHRIFYKMISGLQNGAPDGLAIVNTASSQVLQFVSYEGVITATGGLASGMTSVDVGVSQDGSGEIGVGALGLTGTGGGAADFTWVKDAEIRHSPGQVNEGQSFVRPALPPQGLAIDNVTVTWLADHDRDGLPDEDDADDDNDGQRDAYELAFGTDPLDRNSRFIPLIQGAPEGLVLVFPGATGISYVIETSEDLSHWNELSVYAGNGGPITVRLPDGQIRRFFRVRAGGM